MPFRINRFEIVNGKLTYKDFTRNPGANAFIDGLTKSIENTIKFREDDPAIPEE